LSVYLPIIFMGLSLLRDEIVGDKQMHWEVCEQDGRVSWFPWHFVIGEKCSNRCTYEAWNFTKYRWVEFNKLHH